MQRYQVVIASILLALLTVGAVKANDIDVVRQFQDALLNGDKQAVAKLVHYPLKRDNPLPPIPSEEAFIEYWDDYFDLETIQRIVGGEPAEVGWRGVMMLNGSIWFRHGKISALRTFTDTYEARLMRAMQHDYARLHPIARGYSELTLECSTHDYRLRLQAHNGMYRLFLWDRHAELINEPIEQLVAEAVTNAGSGMGRTFHFVGDGNAYGVVLPGVCSGGADCMARLHIPKDGSNREQVCADLPGGSIQR